MQSKMIIEIKLMFHFPIRNNENVLRYKQITLHNFIHDQLNHI